MIALNARTFQLLSGLFSKRWQHRLKRDNANSRRSHLASVEKEMELRAKIKFCFKLGKSAAETFELMKTVYGSEVLSRKNVFKWYARFRDGRDSLEDDPRPGHSVTVRNDKNIEKVAKILRNDRCDSTRLIEEATGIPKSTVHLILTENLGKRKVCARFVPHTLTDDQKHCRLEHCRDMQQKRPLGIQTSWQTL
ncbi:protein GVQW3-like [Uloborus diversus]|uniref:protein GVQW3-like n=1 Tax=Uloborus diversus TaxID=327109 RepID=UPI0024096379|nr:protein GVQW3-like [Uloborus diversus]